MNGNRQNNGCQCRPNVIGNQPCCNAVPVRPVGCCNDATVGAVIVGGCADACNKETTLRDWPIAMAYVPWQSYGNLYAQPQALRNGTAFAELNLDFAGRRCNQYAGNYMQTSADDENYGNQLYYG